MSSIVLSPGATGAAAFTIEAPSTATSRVITLPDATDTLVGKATTDTLTNKSIAATQLTGTVAAARLPAGSVLQVVQGTLTSVATTTSGSYVDTGLSATITPTSSSSKIFVVMYGGLTERPAVASECPRFKIIRGASTFVQGGGNWYYSTSATDLTGPVFMSCLDSPATTSATTYKLQFESRLGNTVYINAYASAGDFASMTLMEIAA